MNRWAIVEVMGHRVYAGRLEEVTLAGVPMLRVHVPAHEERTTEHDWRERFGRSCRVVRDVTERYAAFEVDLGGGALFAVTTVSEEAARRVMGQRGQARPPGSVERVEGEWRDTDPPPQLVDAAPADPNEYTCWMCQCCGWVTHDATEGAGTCKDCGRPEPLTVGTKSYTDIRPLSEITDDTAEHDRLRPLRSAHFIDDRGSRDIPF